MFQKRMAYESGKVGHSLNEPPRQGTCLKNGFYDLYWYSGSLRKWEISHLQKTTDKA